MEVVTVAEGGGGLLPVSEERLDADGVKVVGFPVGVRDDDDGVNDEVVAVFESPFCFCWWL